MEKGVGGGGGETSPPPPPPEANDIWKCQIKWNHFFHHMGPEYIFSLFLRPYYFLVPLLSHFICFLHIKNQNTFFLDTPHPRYPNGQSLMLYANNKGADQPAHLRSLISTFAVRWLDTMISLVSILAIS